MQQRISSDIGVKVILFMRKNSQIRAKDQSCIESVNTEVNKVDLGEFADDPQTKTEHQNQGGVNSFDPPTVKVEKWEVSFDDLFGDDLGN